KLLQQQKQVIDATETAILALDVHGKIVWKTQKASDLLNHYLPELEGFEAGLKAWFSDLEHEKDPKKLTSCFYSTPSQQLQLLLLTPW
ncbi:hypothetical protein, partial [Escherichia marmotae]